MPVAQQFPPCLALGMTDGYLVSSSPLPLTSVGVPGRPVLTEPTRAAVHGPGRPVLTEPTRAAVHGPGRPVLTEPTRAAVHVCGGAACTTATHGTRQPPFTVSTVPPCYVFVLCAICGLRVPLPTWQDDCPSCVRSPLPVQPAAMTPDDQQLTQAVTEIDDALTRCPDVVTTIELRRVRAEALACLFLATLEDIQALPQRPC